MRKNLFAAAFIAAILCAAAPAWAQAVNASRTAVQAGSVICTFGAYAESVPCADVRLGVPTVTGTGTPVLTTGSTDAVGEATGGAAATSIVVTFSSAKTAAPFCVVTTQSPGVTNFSYVPSTTALTISQDAFSGNKINWACFQR